MKEKTFNKWFNLFILVGMISVVVVVNLIKMQEPEANVVKLLVVTLGAVMGVFNCVMSANGLIWNFLFGLVNVSIAAYTNWDAGNMGQFILHVCYFLPMQFVGIWQWRKQGAGKQADGTQAAPKALRLSGKQWAIVGASVVAGIGAVYTILYYVDVARLGGADQVERGKILLDAIVMVLNITGQVLLSLCYSDSWYVWVLVNVFSIALWVNRCAAPGSGTYAPVMVVKYSFFFINSLNGVRIWRRLSQPQKEEFS
jgi:nicotinamide mononucleotide transporter